MKLKTRWIDFLHQTALGSRRIRNFYTPIGALFYGLIIFLFIVIALRIDEALRLPRLFPGSLNIILSIPTFSMALLFIGWSVTHFIRVRGTPVPFNPPPQLVSTGPYAYTRNPMLTGVFALMFGFGFIFESISLLVLFTPLFIVINTWELKAIEEPVLVKRLGDAYIEYRNSTPMFVPDIFNKNV